MKKLITILLVVFSLNASAQKDTTAKDTVYVLSQADMQAIVGVLRQNTITLDKQPLTFDAILNWIQYLERKMMVIPKKEK